jgi:hypothetical protein
MKKQAVILFSALWVLSLAPAAFGAVSPSSCIITIEKLELKNNSGEWVTLLQPDLQVDLVVKDPSLSFSNASGKIPPGNYINFRVILSETIKVSGRDHENMTKADGEVEITGSAMQLRDLPGVFSGYKEKSATWNLSAEAPIKVHLNFNNGDSDDVMTVTRRRDFADPLEIKKGSFVYVWFMLDLVKTLYYAEPASLGNNWPPNRGFYFLPPNKIDGAIITVDARKEEMSGDDVGLWF